MECPSAQKQTEARLVAKFLAAFSTDNLGRIAAGSPPFTSKRYIGIIMIGLAPAHFYKIIITQALVDAVMAGELPTEETILEHFTPPVPNMSTFLHEGLVPLENRRICFQCFEALKTLL